MKTLLNRIKDFAESATGLTIFRQRPRGLDVFADIQRDLPKHSMKVLFDVGANIGQTVDKFRQAFPDSEIYSFEPVSSSFEKLVSSFGDIDGVTCVKAAIGDSNCYVKVTAEGCATSNRIVDSDEIVARFETVQQFTLDDYCNENDIQTINYLKIDAEGADLAVLNGASALLSRGRVDFVEAECGMNIANQTHSYFLEIVAFMATHGYHIFSIYEQVGEHIRNKPLLRRANIVFVASHLIVET